MHKWGLPIQQHCISGFEHGAWMDWVLDRTENADIILFLDVDCIIIDNGKAMSFVYKAKNGTLVGNEQATNHLGLDVASRIFAAPSFLAVNRSTWKALGRPTCKATPYADVGQNLTDTWEQAGVPVELLRVSGAESAKWDLPGKPMSYGIGTTFEDATYHLFESREPANTDRFLNKCVEVLKRIDMTVKQKNT